MWVFVRVKTKVNKRVKKELNRKQLLGNGSTIAENRRVVFTGELLQIEKSGGAPEISEAVPKRKKIKTHRNQQKNHPNKPNKNCGCMRKIKKKERVHIHRQWVPKTFRKQKICSTVIHQKLIKTNRGFLKRCYSPVNDHEEPNIGVRRTLFMCCKVKSLQNIRKMHCSPKI